MDTELGRFKYEISLSDYAQAELGCKLMKGESSRASKVLQCGGEKVVVTRQQDGQDVYFSVGDQTDCGSILDFVQKRKGLNLGQLRKNLRLWLPSAKRSTVKRPTRSPDRPEAVPQDRADVMRRWASMEPYSGSYLTEEWCIEARIIKAFNVRQDERGNACFPHRDGVGVMGWEVKNKGFTGFSAGRLFGLMLARLDGVLVTRIVVTVATIDAMSYAQMRHQPGTAYVSVGESMSQYQREQLQGAIRKMSVPVVLAFDNDTAGEEIAREVAAMVLPGLDVTRDTPHAAKDWNEALQALQRSQADTDRSGSVPRQ